MHTYDPSVHLSFSDIAVDNLERPAVLRLTIKQSKTDQFRKGVDLFLGKTDTDIRPVRALLNYLILHGTAQRPLFILEDDSFQTHHYFVSAVTEGHCRRQGSISQNIVATVFRLGQPQLQQEDSIIKTLGRWQSVAYLQDVGIPRSQLAIYSKLLCS